MGASHKTGFWVGRYPCTHRRNRLLEIELPVTKQRTVEGADVRDDVDRIISKLGLEGVDFYQADVLKQIDDPFRGVWTAVYAHHGDQGASPSVFACIAEPRLKQEILSGDAWIKHANSFSPGFCESASGVAYLNGQDDGYYFLVAEEYFHPMEREQLLLNQEFILLFNLYRGNDGNYYDIDESGNKLLVVRFDDEVRIRTSYLMRYIAVKQMLFVQFIDSRVSSSEHYPMNAEKIHDEERQSDQYHYKLWFCSTHKEDYLLSMVYARSIVEPRPRETCDILLFEHKEAYPEFPIAERPDGSLVRFTCDPDRLNNYFDSNPGAPMYLTPVFFKPDVLDKYRKNPYFTVSERRLACGSQWGVEIDNVIPSRVMVYLGDLGKDVPEKERQHFLEHVMSPADQKVSQEAFANDILNAWVDPTGPISQLVLGRKRLDETWLNVFGWRLFREPHPDDSDMEKLIRVPSGNSREEFDTVILNLDKYLIEYIDESQLTECTKQGSINKLTEFLNARDIDADLTALRDLQSLRSTSSAHAKGKKYDKAKENLLTGDAANDIETLIRRLASMMDSLADAIVFGDARTE